MKMSQYFKGGTVVEDLESKNKLDAIHELLEKAPFISSPETIATIEEAVVAREKIYTTGIGHGIAIAHGKTASLCDIIILLGISRDGINFDSLDGEPVHLLFLIANPPEKTNEYLVALSTIARIMRNRDFTTALVHEHNPRMAEKLIAKEFMASYEGRSQN